MAQPPRRRHLDILNYLNNVLAKYGVGTGVMPGGGGWRYEQPLPQGGLQRIPPKGCAGTDGALVRQVEMFRVNNGIDVGDVASDVAEYIKVVSPMNNRFPGRRPVNQPEAQPKFRPGIERIKDWLITASQKAVRLLIEDDADARFTICSKCPHNVKWQTGCISCGEAVKHRGQNLRQRAAYKHDDQLGACKLHALYLPAAVFLDRDNLPEVNPQAPEFCWLR